MTRGNQNTWLSVVYRVPSKPSTARIAVWKQAKELGGLPLQQSMYLFPDTPEMRLRLAQLERLVEQSGGESTILGVTALDDAQERTFTESFNQLRNEEYAEVIEDCQALLQHMEREIARGRFDTAEAEDVTRHLEKIRELAGAIVARDSFGSSRREEMLELVGRAEAALLAGMKTVSDATDEDVAALAATSAEAVSLGAKVQEQRVYARAELMRELQVAIHALGAGTMRVDDFAVPPLPESAMLKLKYSDRRGKRCVEIEVEW